MKMILQFFRKKNPFSSFPGTQKTSQCRWSWCETEIYAIVSFVENLRRYFFSCQSTNNNVDWVFSKKNFFQEKSSGKNKLVPRLLGINKESIVRVDERSKDVRKMNFFYRSTTIGIFWFFQFLQVWPLTHVKRWTASPNTFTLVCWIFLHRFDNFPLRILEITPVHFTRFKRTKVNKSHSS